MTMNEENAERMDAGNGAQEPAWNDACCCTEDGSGGCGCGAPEPTNARLTDEYFAIIEKLGGDLEGRRAAQAYMQDSTAIVHGKVVECSFIPRLFNNTTRDVMKYVSEALHGILVKVIEHYLEDPAYRAAFEYDERLRELILLPRGYRSVLPFARIDAFLDEEHMTMRLCEVNGDGSSGMNENREITVSVAGTPTMREFVRNHRIETCELFHSWVDKFIEVYRGYDHAVQEPRFAIVDYLENGVVDEFKMYCQFFRLKGYPCEVADVRELTFDGTALRDAQGRRIHAVWRRCVTNDVLDHWDESQALIEAVRREKVALIGSFAGHIVHDKQIFRVLADERTQAFLTDEERFIVQETVPYTAFLTEAEIAAQGARENKDGWIIKPADHYAADQVYAGLALSQEQWEARLRECADGRAGCTFVLQRYVTPFRTDTLAPDAGIEALADGDVRTQRVSWNNLSGMYVYDGEFTGVFSRLGPLPTISKDMRGMTAATIWVTE